MWCPQCGAEYREGFDRCSSCDVDLVAEQEKRQKRRRSPRTFFIVLGAVLLVVAVVVWHAWPTPSHRRPSLAVSRQVCSAFAEHHGGQLGGNGSESVSNAVKLDRHFNMGASAFLASVPKSQGLASCIVMASADLPACAFGPAAPKVSQVLVTLDGSRYVDWCSNRATAP